MGLFRKLFSVLKVFGDKFFAESSVHCFPYVVKKDIHVVERVFWLVVVIFSAVCAYWVFSIQLQRFQESPTVLSIEILARGDFPLPSFTVCTDLSDNITEIAAKEVIEKYWEIDPSSPEYELHFDFVSTVSLLKYYNIYSLSRFVDIPKFNNVDLLSIAFDMKSKLPRVGLAEHPYVPVITEVGISLFSEVGICQTSSIYYKFQNPLFRSNHTMTFEPEPACKSQRSCKSRVSPNNPTSANVIFVQEHIEVTCGDDKTYEVLISPKSLDVSFKVEEIVSDPAVAKIEPKRRKCLFANEPQPGSHFDVYTTNLCKISCRINQALKYCHCMPFFYAVFGPPVCNITEMLCLDKNQQWFDTTHCECPNLCDRTIVTRVESQQTYFHGSFDSTMSIDLTFPKTRIRRSVLFSFFDLVVAFGGSVALFLGCSFLTCVEMIFFATELLFDLVLTVVGWCCRKNSSKSVRFQ